MIDAITQWMRSVWRSVSASPPVHAMDHHSLGGPLFGNVLVAVGAGIVTVACIVIALRMLIRPGERDPRHPKYRVLDEDR